MKVKYIIENEEGEFGDYAYWKARGYGGDAVLTSMRTGKATRPFKNGKSHTFFLKECQPVKQDYSKRKKVDPWNKGKHLSEETKLKIGKSRREAYADHIKPSNLCIPEGYVSVKCLETSTATFVEKCKARDIRVHEFYYKSQKVLAIKEEDVQRYNTALNPGGHSKWENDFAENFPTLKRGDRVLIKPLELDFVDLGKKVAVECDGLYTHNETSKPTTYHLAKTRACEVLGIRLIHIFEDEWREKKVICKSIVNSALGIYDRKLYARDCTFKPVDKKVAKTFLDENHIAGSCGFTDAYGLFYRDTELVQLVCFRKNFAQRSNKDIELARMVTKINTQVLGGFSKLMKHQPYDFVTSFVDRRLFDCKGYNSSGWKHVGYSQPAYHYTDCYSRFNRQSFMKTLCLKRWPDCDTSMTEHEMCNLHKLYRIYDCGCFKVEWRR